MLRLSPTQSIGYWDLARVTAGREDAPELIDRCWQYLEERNTNEFRVVSLDRTGVKRTKAELVAAHVQTEIASRGGISSLQRRLADAEATIDRLLAFVPVRSGDLGRERLDMIVQELLATVARELHGVSRTTVQVVDESDPETTACHRMMLTVDWDVDNDPIGLASAVTLLHQRFAQLITPAEFPSINLLVETSGL